MSVGLLPIAFPCGTASLEIGRGKIGGTNTGGVGFGGGLCWRSRFCRCRNKFGRGYGFVGGFKYSGCTCRFRRGRLYTNCSFCRAKTPSACPPSVHRVVGLADTKAVRLQKVARHRRPVARPQLNRPQNLSRRVRQKRHPPRLSRRVVRLLQPSLSSRTVGAIPSDFCLLHAKSLRFWCPTSLRFW